VTSPPDTEFWTATDLTLLGAMPLLLVASAFFSGAETSLFGLTARQRIELGHNRGERSAALVLLRQPRQLLITLLLGNMLANVLYFVLGSILTWNQPWGAAGAVLLPLATLLAIVLFGEITPKMIASARAPLVARLVSPPLLALHGGLLPVRVAIDRCIIRPLSHLATPSGGTARLALEELDALIGVSGRDGLVDAHEQRLLADVLMLGERHLADVMTPRTRMVSVPETATQTEVDEIIRKHRLMRLPVRGQDLDDIRGFLHVKDWLRSPGDLTAMLKRPVYLPEATTIDLALEAIRHRGAQTAIVVDEFGGTAGIVSLHDLIEPIVGDIADDASQRPGEARPLGPGRWMVPGDFPAARLTEALLGRSPGREHATTVAGLMTHELQRLPVQGDVITLGNVALEVHHAVRGGRVEAVIVSVEEPTS